MNNSHQFAGSVLLANHTSPQNNLAVYLTVSQVVPVWGGLHSMIVYVKNLWNSCKSHYNLENGFAK